MPDSTHCSSPDYSWTEKKAQHAIDRAWKRAGTGA